jgi:hypothetical protein
VVGGGARPEPRAGAAAPRKPRGCACARCCPSRPDSDGRGSAGFGPIIMRPAAGAAPAGAERPDSPSSAAPRCGSAGSSPRPVGRRARVRAGRRCSERGDRKARRGRPGGAACAAPRRVADTGRDSDGTRSGNRWRRLFVPVRAGGLLAGDVWSARHALDRLRAVRSIGATVAFQRMGSPLAQRRKRREKILSIFARRLSCATLMVCVACRFRCLQRDR